MLNKYQNFLKISKTDECSFYTAISRDTSQGVLIKRFKNKLEWDEVLTNQNLQYSQRSKMFPRMIEIFKSKGEFYIIYQQPSGPSFRQTDDIGKMAIDDFYILFQDLCKHIQELKSIIPGLYIVPQWIFIHRNSSKIAHFQPFFTNHDALSSEHVYLYKIQNQKINPQKEQSQQSIVPAEQRRNLIFNLGMVAYYLLTGRKKIQVETQEQYLNICHQITENAQKRIISATNDKKIALMVAKMLSSNIFEKPDLQKFANLIFSKAKDIIPKNRHPATNLQISLQTIKLSPLKKIQLECKKRLRTCCAQKQAVIDQINEEIKNQKEKQCSTKKLPSYREDIINKSIEYIPRRNQSFLPIIEKRPISKAKAFRQRLRAGLLL